MATATQQYEHLSSYPSQSGVLQGVAYRGCFVVHRDTSVADYLSYATQGFKIHKESYNCNTSATGAYAVHATTSIITQIQDQAFAHCDFCPKRRLLGENVGWKKRTKKKGFSVRGGTTATYSRWGQHGLGNKEKVKKFLRLSALHPS